MARRNRIPDPTVGVRGGRVDYGNVRDNVVGVSLNIPLFVRNSYHAEVVAAQADADVAIAEAQRIQLELTADRQRAVDDVGAVRKEVEDVHGPTLAAAPADRACDGTR